ncbi:MAG TPA: adenylate/guanylate cyclase domain-containing protein [Mycobacteriales bacterium]|nr:adenylate/guanylate cyclase domain-containing protein [Mycobacteriales bacterium]
MPAERVSGGAETELDYMRRQLDELAAETLRLSRRAQTAGAELEVRRRGFALLASLGQTLGAHTDLEPALASVLPLLESKLHVQRTVALRRSGDAYEPFSWTGYPPDATPADAGVPLAVPDAVLAGGGTVGADDADDGWVLAARTVLGVPAFIVVPVSDAGCLLVVGRMAKRSGFFAPFNDVDCDTVHAVADLVAAAVQNARMAALNEVRRFLAPSVVEELMKGRLTRAEVQERREVTLLSADMVGFTALADRVAPDVLARILDSYLRDMTSLAYAYQGTVNTFAGDGILVIFGAPTLMAPEEHAWAAAQAAFAMRTQMPRLVESLRASLGETSLELRIGLNTGICAVGVFGSDTHRTYAAIGMPTNLAARLEGAAAPGEVLVSPRTLELLGGRVTSSSRGPLTLKGISHPVVAHAVEPAAQQRARVDPPLG